MKEAFICKNNKVRVADIKEDKCVEVKYDYQDNIEEILKTLVRYAKYHYNIYKKPLEDIDVRIRPALEDFRNILSDMPASPPV